LKAAIAAKRPVTLQPESVPFDASLSADAQCETRELCTLHAQAITHYTQRYSENHRAWTRMSFQSMFFDRPMLSS
jgi:hypothetical protein